MPLQGLFRGAKTLSTGPLAAAETALMQAGMRAPRDQDVTCTATEAAAAKFDANRTRTLPMMRRINRFVAAALLLGAQGPTFAAQHAHVHGIAKLQVAVDGPTLTLVLSSPLDNLLGFEHAPRTAKEKAAAADLTARLGKPETLLVPSPAAGCTVASAKVDAPTLEGHSAAKSAAKGTTAAPAHSEKAGHDHGEHSDVTAEYVFRCQRPEDLRGLEVKLLEPFRRLRHVEAQVVGPKGQSATKLTPAKRQLSW